MFFLFQAKFKRANFLVFLSKLTAGLLVFLFLISPLASVRAEEQSEPIETPIISEEPTTNDPEQNNETTEPIEEPTNSDGTQADENSQPTETMNNEDKKVENKLNIGVDSVNNFGSLHFNFPIIVPAGRNNQRPNIDLVYDSQSGRGSDVFGFGWSSSVPYIERINQKGVNKLYTNNDIFNSSLDGEISKINSETTEWYRAKSDSGQFLTYQFVDEQHWVATDKQGTKYTFGYNALARQDDSNNTNRIYRWMLEEILDVNGNKINYEYYKDQGQIYPAEITYSNFGATVGIFEINFNRQIRPDQTSTRETDFIIKTIYRINEIVVKVNGLWTKKYALSYVSGDNGQKSLLDQIVESGHDEVTAEVKILPPTNFDYQVSGQGWTLDANRQVPINFNTTHKFIDINGDSLADIIAYTPSSNIVYINNGDNWQIDSNYQLPSMADIFSSNIQWADVNGDGFTDILDGANYNIYINNANGAGWTLNSNWQIPLTFSTTNEAVMDINGDNLADIIYYCSGCSINNRYQVHLNNGSGWTQSFDWSLPTETFDQLARFGDINGDGLIDLLHLVGNQSGEFGRIYINNGTTGWVHDPSWNMPENFLWDQVVANDINHDGLMDLMVFRNAWQNPQRRAFINNGNGGWTYNSNWELPSEIFSTNTGYLADINGDGLIDIVNSENGYPVDSRIYTINGEKTELLNSVTTSAGGITTISYKGSAEYKNAGDLLNPFLPINLQTVNSIQENPVNGSTSTTTFSYSNGFYYNGSAFDRKLAGFEKIISSDDLGTVKTFYHQGNDSNSSKGEYQDHASKIGRMYRQEIYDLNNNLFSKTINKWDKHDLGNSRNFVKLIRATQETYDGNSSHKDSAETYDYDNTNGNKINIIQWGEVDATDNGDFTDVGTDKFITDVTYASGSNNNVIALPATQVVNDQNFNKVTEARSYYDNLPLGQVNFGNQTKQEQWQGGNNYINTQKVYNQYGLVTTEIDPLSRQTNYTYDAYNLYPVAVVNPANQTNSFSYDYSSGKVTSSVDVNGQIFSTYYDGLDRPVTEMQPDPNALNSSVVKSTYEYTDISNANRVKQSNYLDANNIIDSYTYFDGLGRKVQERREAEGNDQFSVRDFIYTQNDLLLKESLPYVSNGSARTAPITTPALYTIYTYDAMKRVLSAQNAVGTTTNNYDDWKTTVTDAKGKIKDLYKDAYDNLVQVNEHNGSSIYSTYYQWNGLKKLIKITDALGNVRNFTYDVLGRVLAAEDLHALGDSTFGIWYYAYDDASNLTSKTAPNTKVTAYTYDNLNRVLTEDAVGTNDIEITYSYDNCQLGIGRLCSVVNSTVISSMFYNSLGQLTQEVKRIGKISYPTQYDYDRQGNQIFIINPDDSQVVYNYNAAGLVDSVQRKEVTDPGLINVIANIDYNPVGLATVMVYGNGSITTNTYDEAELYRLRHKVTVADSQNVQDLTYTYDAVGNILEIIDASSTQTAKTTDYTYDDLHRLLSATISNSTAQNVDGENNQNQLQTLTYDAIGNILTKSDVGTYSYGGNVGDNYANPHAVTDAGNNYYTYDQNGNITDISSIAIVDSKSFLWDYGNRLTTVIVNGKASSYAYDAGGQRVKEESPSGTTLYPTKDYSVTPTGEEKHIFLGDMAIATVAGKEESAKVYDIHADHLTGSNVITDANQQVDELTDYYSFGTIRLDEQNGGRSEKRKFTGHEYDLDTGLTYANARYYDAKLGRWLSQDSVFLAVFDDKQIEEKTKSKLQKYLAEPQNLNSYSYVKNNPLAYVDYTGEWPSLPEMWNKTKEGINNFANKAGDKLLQGIDYAYDNKLYVGTAAIGGAAALGAGGLAVGGAAVGVGILETAGIASIRGMTVRDQLLKASTDSKLRSIVNQLYRPGAAVGDGGTADALRFETQTGILLSKSGHLEKAIGRITELTRYLTREVLSPQNRAIGQALLNDLKDAVKSAKK